MLLLNHDALRAALTADFHALSHDAKGAAQICLVLEELLNATKNILSDLASEWNDAHNALCRMPAEILAMCFTPLNLRNSMTVTHVSRSWRAVALAHRALWSRIYLESSLKDAPAYMQMLVSRTGKHPIDFHGPWRTRLDVSAVRTIASCLAQHMSQLRTIAWYSKELDLPYSQPAPFLERFWADKCDLVIPADFLGGQAGRLETLALSTVCFPPTCPALSTLSYLFVEFQTTSPRVPEYAASFSRIFELCPRLQSLYLRDVQLEDADFLPTTPAPRTLFKLELMTTDPRYDLIRHYVDWKFRKNLTDVALEVDESTFADCRLEDLVHDSTELLIVKDGGVIGIEAHGPAKDTVRSIGFKLSEPDDDDYSRVGELVWKAQSGLCQVESLRIPLLAVDDFVDEDVFLQALPKLAVLTVVIMEISTYGSGWDSLVSSLHGVAEACPLLSSIRLDFESWDEVRLLSADVARELLAAFEQNMLTVPEIWILGFEPDAMDDVRIPDLGGCRIEFCGSADLEDTASETKTE